MNTDALKRMSYETLAKLKDAIEKEISGRMDFSVRVGRTGHFVDRDGTKIYCRIERVNPKSLTVRPLDPMSKGGWRISRSMMVMDGIPIKGAEPKRSAPSTAPSANYQVEQW